MANVIITLKIMPESPDVNLSEIEHKAKRIIAGFAGEGTTKTEKEPIAFGLVALKITFVADEKKGGTEGIEADISGIEGVQSVEVIDVRRALG